MSKTILIVTGSARPNSTGEQLLPVVKSALHQHAVETKIANMRKLQLPFVDSEIIPAADDFTPPHESVATWQRLVRGSDGIVFLTPEYNNQLSAVQKNAIDWLYNDWSDKPIAAIGYSWSGAEPAIAQLERLMTIVGATLLPTRAQLRFSKDIATDGAIIDESVVDEKITATIDELVIHLANS